MMIKLFFLRFCKLPHFIKLLIPVDKKMLIPLYFDISYNIGWFDTSPEGILNDLTPKENKFLKTLC